MRPTFPERFWPKVCKDGPVPSQRPELGPCWVWQAWTNNKGYGYRNCRACANMYQAALRQRRRAG